MCSVIENTTKKRLEYDAFLLEHPSTTRNGLNMQLLRIVWGQGVRHITCMKEPLRYSHIRLISGYIIANSPSTVIGLMMTLEASLLELHL